MSGVAVATRSRSISSGEIFACSIALSAAFAAMSLVVSSLAAMRRSLIPVRVVIHSSLVSTVRDDADAIDAEERAATVFFVVGFIFNGAKRFLRQKRAQLSHRRPGQFVL